MRDFELVFYRKANGDCPVSDFFADLVAQGKSRKPMVLKLLHAMDLLEQFGNRPKGDFSRSIKDGDGIFELRAQTKTDICRIFYFFDKNGKIVLCHGIVKKVNKVPFSEVQLVWKERADYLSRCQEQNKKQGRGDTMTPFTIGSKFRPQLDQIVAEANAKRGGVNETKTEKDLGR